MSDAKPGPDGLLRCPWALGTPEYVAYHDDEWGMPLDSDDAMFERLTLEGFQSGLSWLIILRKRPAFRAAFAGFAIDAVAAFTDDHVERLMGDPGIVRNRAKIRATIRNAQIVADLPGGLLRHVAGFKPKRHKRPKQLADVVSESAESTALAKDLRGRGARFVGPTTAYALMQATGLVDDHLVDCFRSVPRR
jgi:DNA-3-methyladenine glycosylase I